MSIRFCNGVRVFWSGANAIVVSSDRLIVFDDPSNAEEQVLAALQSGLPEVDLLQQSVIVGVPAHQLKSLLLKLAPVLKTESAAPTEVDDRLRQSELVRYELNHRETAQRLASIRQGTMVTLAGADSAVRLLAASLDLAGIPNRKSQRGYRVAQAGPIESGWHYSHRTGTISERIEHIAVGFFHEQIDPDATKYWISRGTKHMAIVFDATGARVSRLVRPGLDRCLDCDPHFTPQSPITKAGMRFQINQMPIPFDDAVNVANTVAEALARIGNFIDRGSAATSTRFFESGSGWNQLTPAPEYPSCGCLLDLGELGSF